MCRQTCAHSRPASSPPSRAKPPSTEDVTLAEVSWWIWLALALAVVALVWLALVIALLVVGRREEARALAAFIPDCLVLISRLIKDDRVPRRRQLLLGALVAYLVCPVAPMPAF